MSPVQPCQRETIALAAAARPDWDETETQNALIRAYQDCWTPARILFETVRLLAIADSEPRDLDAALARRTGWGAPGTGLSNSARPRRVTAGRG
jgi:hypothetical protein